MSHQVVDKERNGLSTAEDVPYARAHLVDDNGDVYMSAVHLRTLSPGFMERVLDLAESEYPCISVIWDVPDPHAPTMLFALGTGERAA